MPITFTGSAATFRTLGNNQTIQNIFLIENKWMSSRVVHIKRVTVQVDTSTGTLNDVMPMIKTCRVTALYNYHIGGAGVVLSKASFDTTEGSDDGVVLRGASDSDGGGFIRIDVAGSGFFWQQYAMRMRNGYGQTLAYDNAILPILVEDTSFVLAPGEALLIQVQGTNPITNHWFVQCVWEETTFETASIGGKVAEGVTNINGAKVFVLIADNYQLDNARLWTIATSDVNGNWTANVPVRKIVSAFAQHKDNDDLFTALGQPFYVT